VINSVWFVYNILCFMYAYSLYFCRVDSVLHWCANFFQNAVFCSYEQVSVVEAVKLTQLGDQFVSPEEACSVYKITEGCM
jgi:hypothetical protein